MRFLTSWYFNFHVTETLCERIGKKGLNETLKSKNGSLYGWARCIKSLVLYQHCLGSRGQQCWWASWPPQLLLLLPNLLCMDSGNKDITRDQITCPYPWSRWLWLAICISVSSFLKVLSYLWCCPSSTKAPRIPVAGETARPLCLPPDSKHLFATPVTGRSLPPETPARVLDTSVQPRLPPCDLSCVPVQEHRNRVSVFPHDTASEVCRQKPCPPQPSQDWTPLSFPVTQFP